MPTILGILGQVVAVLRLSAVGLLAVAVVLAALAWAVRSRRIQPFGAAGRFVRRAVDPLLAPFDRRLVRFGVTGASVPWWAVLLLLMGLATLIFLVGFVREALASAYFAANAGPRGILVLLVSTTFTVLQVALLVRVVTSWIGGTYSAVGRLAVRLTEWFLGPLRRALPTMGMVDISPLVAWFLLILVERAILTVL